MHDLPPILFQPTHTLPPYSIPAHAYPPPVLFHPMHALPLFYPSLRMPSPLFYPIPRMPFPLFYPSPCMPSPYSIPAHACPPPILSQLMHTLPLFYPSPRMPSYSFPPHAYPPTILSHPMHVLSCSLPAHTCTPLFYSILFQPMHALLTPCHIHRWQHVSPLTSACTTFESAYTIIIYLAWRL